VARLTDEKDADMLTTKEINVIKSRLLRQAEEDHQRRTRLAEQAAYARKANAVVRKGRKRNGSNRDIFSKGRRLPGAGFCKS
jgi:hypothetical protein